jgi:transposase InsO family protein
LVSTDPRSARSAGRADEERLTDDIIELADQYGRYGYRMVTGLLNNAGWHVNHKRVERIWRREGLKVPQKQKKKGTALAERRVVRASATRAPEPRLVL